jgi:aminoglycoside phosphotransferase (APT) family kinase protein
MSDPLLGAKLLTLFEAVRADLRPELQSGHAKLRCDLIEMLLARMAVETDAAAIDTSSLANEQAARNRTEDKISELIASPIEQRGSSKELAIEPQVITDWLAARGLLGTVNRIHTVPGGRSKGTLLLDLADGDALVIRLDFAAAVTGTSVRYEYPVIAAAFRAGLPVPEPLAYEDSPDVIGGRFILFRKVAGKAMGTLFASDASPAFCKQFAAALARLHSLDVDAAGLTTMLEFGDAANPVEALLDKREAEYRNKVQPEPLIDAAFAWLREQLPTIGVERRLIHGDAALHNTMGEGDRLTALLDWEFAHLGDPAEDLAYCRFLVSKLLPWPEFMEAYRAAGGPEVSDARLSFFTIWRTLTLSVWTGMARQTYDSDADRDLRVAAIGHNTFPRQLRALANDLVQEMNAVTNGSTHS